MPSPGDSTKKVIVDTRGFCIYVVMFVEDLQQRDRPNDLSQKSQLGDRIGMRMNPTWIDPRGLYHNLAMAVLVGDRILSLHNRNPQSKL
jgi:hypothetical protein